MKRRKSPQEKKRLEYDRETKSKGRKSVHGFRKSWPRKKAIAQRVFRHRLREEAERLGRGADSDTFTVEPQIRRTRVRKHAIPLRDWIEDRHRRREGAHGAKARRRAQQEQLLLDGIARFFEPTLRRARLPADGSLQKDAEVLRKDLMHRVGHLSSPWWRELLRLNPVLSDLLRARRAAIVKEREKEAARRRRGAGH
jgi:hypothetical protein